MKYPAKIYARAFTEAATGKHTAAQEDKFVKNLVALTRKNGDMAALPKILAAAEKMIREKEGLRKVTLETARTLDEKFKKRWIPAFAGMTERAGMTDEKKTILEEKIVPELVAGVRVTLNDEMQLDVTLARKLQKMLG